VQPPEPGGLRTRTSPPISLTMPCTLAQRDSSGCTQLSAPAGWPAYGPGGRTVVDAAHVASLRARGRVGVAQRKHVLEQATW
jgi:hypothetical protein